MSKPKIQISVPSLEDLRRIGDSQQLHCTDEELEVYKKLMSGTQASLQLIADLPDVTLPPVKYPRGFIDWPTAKENSHNAWYVKCKIEGAPGGTLHGRTVAVKDNVPVNGVPMMNGSRLLEGLVPDHDATVVTRLLDAGCTILGKSTCENFCVDGVSYNTDKGPVLNPHNPVYSAGGSSSGSAVLVAIGEVDMAVGADQAGSIRMPASSCGIVGMKPTFGLVPYTGALSSAATRDHMGPMARNVADCALMLEAMAGYDHNDGRQHACCRYNQDFRKFGEPVDQLKVGILKEGFDSCDPEVLSICSDAVELLKQSNKFQHFKEISIPLHTAGAIISEHVLMEQARLTISDGCGMPMGLTGFHSSSMMESIFNRVNGNQRKFSPNLKLLLLWAQHVQQNYGPQFFAKSRCYAEKLREEYNTALEKVDILLLPTMKILPPKIPNLNGSIEEFLAPMQGLIANCVQTSCTGHPALSLNCGHSTAGQTGQNVGIPVGLMIVGRMWEDDVVLRAAATCERQLRHLVKSPVLDEREQ